MAMKFLKPSRFEKIAGHLNGIWQEFIKTIDGNALFGSSFRNALRCLEENGKRDLAAKFETIEDELENIIRSETPPEDRLVITHGDCWINNIMLGYEVTKIKSIHVKPQSENSAHILHFNNHSAHIG